MPSTPTFLLIEDSPFDRTLIQAVFELVAPEVVLTVVPGGQAARSYVQTTMPAGPQVVLLGLHLDDEQVWAVLACLRQQGPWATMPVMVLGAALREDDLTRAYGLGVSACVHKPDAVAEWEALVQQLVVFWSGVQYHSGTGQRFSR
ncbi:response regulator [Deinococcus sp. HMF7620]|uniref:Response regulator n=1 Tax=Deinococcus arboris TaxID=2682977 RepID=A0A7C9HRN6_9DEIO|nr:MULTISPECIES: response regulator [Deinococcus]MBZ9750826.1 response regulator [Deinococcus betulae]MVN87012.1 response regulator [Deinococcus arboris]